jgi:hypothetical protein
MKPIRLTDEQLDAVMTAARPISVESRNAFLQQVAASLQSCAVVGPGAVHRAIVEARRAHFSPPDLSRANGSSRWR